ncbi:g12300 [Coccomyxa viridis]|uniref:G12300 protein n=1 Tax=Coccomyxa viridis TaxID=1274662 RepID=A0ABP1GA11_9CHLO
MVCIAKASVTKPLWARTLRSEVLSPTSRRSFRGFTARRILRTRGPTPSYAQVGLFFSTSTGKTEDVASIIKEKMGTADAKDISDVDVSTLVDYDGLVVGAPTWNTGADSERSGTGWDDVLSDISGLDLNGKPVAVFGLGDSVSYGEYFCDAMEEVYRHFKNAGAKMVGHWPADDYQHEDSKSLLDDGKFCGLALDEDNEDDKTEGRVAAWVEQLKGEGF